VKRQDKVAIAENNVLLMIEKVLDDGQLASSLVLNEEEYQIVKGLHLLTMKPILYAFNKKMGGKNLDEMDDPRWEEVEKFLDDSSSKWLKIDTQVEHELKDLVEDEREEYKQNSRRSL